MPTKEKKRKHVPRKVQNIPYESWFFSIVHRTLKAEKERQRTIREEMKKKKRKSRGDTHKF